MVEKYNYILVQLDNLISKYGNIDTDSDKNKTGQTSKILTHVFKSSCNVKQELVSYISQLPVIGFNCGRYDIISLKGTS